MTRPEIETCADARGKSFAVDAPGSGYAYIGYQILRNKCGFEPNVDYPVVVTGGTDRRYDDLIANKANSQMVLIHTGLPERAEAKGIRLLSVLDPTAAVRQSAAEVHPSVLTRALAWSSSATIWAQSVF